MWLSRIIVRRFALRLLILAIPGVLMLIGAIIWWLYFASPTGDTLSRWFEQPNQRTSLVTRLTKPCPGAPFLLPSSGFVGFLYADPSLPYTPFNSHTGIDIFGDGLPGTIPVYAAYDGYLTRLAEWRSAVIIRHPQDPLMPSRQIWTYYAHMASKTGESYIVEDFPPNTHEKFVKQGTLLGYQGLYSGNSTFGIGLHVHFSIVLSEANGTFKNEGRIDNTLDPSPYLGFNVHAGKQPNIPVQCGAVAHP
ncbi:MAG: hypothetical protein OHK0023_15140 [Anaerolineae bacterium]